MSTTLQQKHLLEVSLAIGLRFYDVVRLQMQQGKVMAN
jgi:hypothetical protein